MLLGSSVSLGCEGSHAIENESDSLSLILLWDHECGSCHSRTTHLFENSQTVHRVVELPFLVFCGDSVEVEMHEHNTRQLWFSFIFTLVPVQVPRVLSNNGSHLLCEQLKQHGLLSCNVFWFGSAIQPFDQRT